MALLARAGARGCNRERLAGMLWPESDERRARHSLSDVLHTLRHDLGDRVVLAIGDTLCLNRSAIVVDSSEFEDAVAHGQLERAASLYSGPFLDGFLLQGSQPFDEWAEAERHALADRYGDVLDSLAVAATAAGDLPSAARWWRQRLEHDPFCSHAAESLMDVMAEAGDRAAAVRVMERHVERLRTDLGVEPARELTRAVHRLRGAGPPRHLATRGSADQPSQTAGRPLEDAGRDATVGAVHVVERSDSESEERIRPAPRRRSIRTAVAVGTVGALIVVVATLVVRPLGTLPLDRSRVAIETFGLVGPGIQPFWARGFAELLAIKLEDGGGVQVRVLSIGEGRAGHQMSPRAAAEHVGAGFVVSGTMASAGPDSIVVRVQLYDAVRDRPIAQFAVPAHSNRLDWIASEIVARVQSLIDTSRSASAP